MFENDRSYATSQFTSEFLFILRELGRELCEKNIFKWERNRHGLCKDLYAPFLHYVGRSVINPAEGWNDIGGNLLLASVK